MAGITDIDAIMASLKQNGEAFAVATVVRTISVTSAKAGAKAIIRADGSLSEGWIGGGCARAAVLDAAREALADGSPRLVSIQPEALLREQGLVPGEERAGIHFRRNLCPSQGTMDIFVEPVSPRPELVICGLTPVARALADLAEHLGFSRTIAAEHASEAHLPASERHIDGFALASNSAVERYIVVATQGAGDRAALTAALQARSAYVGFVGSRRKAASLKQKLIADGLAEEAFAELKAPAGLDLKAITPEEIALSILAEIIKLRRSRQMRTVRRSTDTELSQPAE